MTEYVCGFVFFRNYVALIRKARPAWQAGRLNGIGGHIEVGETAPVAMARECCEETMGALNIPADEWTHFATLSGDDYAWTHRTGADRDMFRVYFFYTELRNWPVPDPQDATRDEPEPIRWYHVSTGEHHRECLPNLFWLIPMAQAGVQCGHDFPYHIQERTPL